MSLEGPATYQTLDDEKDPASPPALVRSGHFKGTGLNQRRMTQHRMVDAIASVSAVSED